MLQGTESLHSTVRRYTSPEEHAFYPKELPGALADLETMSYPDLLSGEGGADGINCNDLL